MLDDDAQHDGVVIAEPATQRVAQHRDLLAQFPLGQLGQRIRVTFPGDQASSIARPDTPSTSEATESSLIPASSSTFCTRWHSAVWVWINRLR